MNLFDNNDSDLPNFLVSKMDKRINEYIENNKVEPISTVIKNKCSSFIKNIIYENLLFIILLSSILVFLLYRYCMKQRRITKIRERMSVEDDTYDIMEFKDKAFVRPTMNPTYPLKRQQNYALYPPGKMPHKTDGENIDFIRDDKVISGRDLSEIGVPSQKFTHLYPNYGYNQSTSNCYSGLVSSYQTKDQRPAIRSALGYATDFGDEDRDFINNNVKKNNRILTTFYNGIISKDERLRKNLNID